MNELRKQQVIDKKVYDQNVMDDAERKLAWKRLQENTKVNDDVMIDLSTGEVLGPEVDYTHKS